MSASTVSTMTSEKIRTGSKRYGRFFGDMELEFGPGIVDRLKSKFVSAASTPTVQGRPSDQRRICDTETSMSVRKISKVKQASDTTTDTILSQSKLLTNDKIIIIDRPNVNGLYASNNVSIRPANNTIASQLVNKSECIEGLVSHYKAIFDGNLSEAPEGANMATAPPVRPRPPRRASIPATTGTDGIPDTNGHTPDIPVSAPLDFRSSAPVLSVPPTPPPRPLRKAALESSRVPKGQKDDSLGSDKVDSNFLDGNRKSLDNESVREETAEPVSRVVPVPEKNVSAFVDKESEKRRSLPLAASQLKRAPPVAPRPAGLTFDPSKSRSTQPAHTDQPKINTPRPVMALSRPISPARRLASEPVTAVVSTVLKPLNDTKPHHEAKRLLSQDSPPFRRSASLDDLDGEKEKEKQRTAARPGKVAKMSSVSEEEKKPALSKEERKAVPEKKLPEVIAEKPERPTTVAVARTSVPRPRSLPEPTPDPSSESDTEKENSGSFRLAFPLKKSANFGMTTIIDTRSCPINPIQSALKIDDPSLLTSLKDLGRARPNNGSSSSEGEVHDIELETMRFVVIGHNSPVGAKSSLKVSGSATKTRAHLRIQFDDKATRTHEYPSERSLLGGTGGGVQLEMDVGSEVEESDTDGIVHLSENRREGDSLRKPALSSYRPGAVQGFNLGLEKPVFVEEPEQKSKEVSDEQRTKRVRPQFHVETESDGNFSNTMSTSSDDLLF